MSTSASAAGATSSSGTGTTRAFQGIDAMMVDHHRGALDGSRGMNSCGTSSVTAAVAAVVATAPAHSSGQDMTTVPMQRVLSAPLLSPPANSEGPRSREGRGPVGPEQHQSRLPPLRQVCYWVKSVCLPMNCIELMMIIIVYCKVQPVVMRIHLYCTHPCSCLVVFECHT